MRRQWIEWLMAGVLLVSFLVSAFHRLEAVWRGTDDCVELSLVLYEAAKGGKTRQFEPCDPAKPDRPE
jgi:hypothetical protein